MSKSKKLQLLWCGKNQLAELDVSKCKQLRRLHCGKNALTELDVSNNAKLWDLYCKGNPLSKKTRVALKKWGKIKGHRLRM